MKMTTTPLKDLYYQYKDKLSLPKPWDYVVIFVLCLLLTLPTFIIVHHNLKETNWEIPLDRIFLFISIALIYFFLLKKIKKVILICIIVYMLILLYGTLFGNYGFYRLYDDYRSMMYTMDENPYPQDIIINKLLPFPNKYKVLKAIDFNTPKVRNFAVWSTTQNFKNVSHLKKYFEYRTTIQCFAVFKEIKKRWNYVNDPQGNNYIASASESLEHFSGDCDDHAILMAAGIKAVGGIPRLIHTDAHIYPEMLIGTKRDLEKINYLIHEVLFTQESKNKPLHYHIDERGYIWLNLDYTANYPGGKFMSEAILGQLTLND
ncbi:transglutaminase-like domain-containing protein [Flavobacterium columnare]|uniref:Transglutaminase family protein n=1 Tax=Flavobacterium columnare TaxID=996 RepID=A0AAI8CGJ1_9FLAO|nr:transglutaminase family protein [Flavobacterium columnare]AMO19564.2 transglutaminase family protein [Flavobacterium columnare]QOG56544.1 transglutaminase family protein [Flavobacterium columnare]QOG59269.1 transglutaminase family protein [Flavobacterium columnare]QOG61989.1 transglutaminase family protein [Flavobacterium columnare]QOG64712.1 transglutaminase family protein [Flavobacterium columnare]